MLLICPGCGKEFNPMPAAGKYRGGRYRKYCSDACRKRVARASLMLPSNPVLNEAASQTMPITRKRTESGRNSLRPDFWVFDWQAQDYGPLFERDALRLQLLVQGQLFQAATFSQASLAYRQFISTEAGRFWLDQQQKQSIAHQVKTKPH